VPDSELLGHISTFMFNGADSVGSAAAWALHHLSLDQTLQGRLREELSHISNDASRSSALESAPLLSCVVRETMRFCPPLPGTIRVACKDDIIRASEDITLCDGSVVREYRIKKGQIIMIPIEPMNILSDYWGEDAKVFNPDRWLNLPETAKSFPGLHGTMTFTFGPHGCPGSNLAFAMCVPSRDRGSSHANMDINSQDALFYLVRRPAFRSTPRSRNWPQLLLHAPSLRPWVLGI
jgi:cytochrome P450